MKNKAPEGSISLRSIHLMKNHYAPETIPIFYIIRNGEIETTEERAHLVGKYLDVPLYHLSLCPSCHSDKGLLAIYEGKLVFLCFGISCLLKIIN